MALALVAVADDIGNGGRSVAVVARHHLDGGGWLLKSSRRSSCAKIALNWRWRKMDRVKQRNDKVAYVIQGLTRGEAGGRDMLDGLRMEHAISSFTTNMMVDGATWTPTGWYARETSSSAKSWRNLSNCWRTMRSTRMEHGLVCSRWLQGLTMWWCKSFLRPYPLVRCMGLLHIHQGGPPLQLQFK